VGKIFFTKDNKFQLDPHTPLKLILTRNVFAIFIRKRESQIIIVVIPRNSNFFFSDTSLKELFGRFIPSSCPLASSSKVYVDITRRKVSTCSLLKLEITDNSIVWMFCFLNTVVDCALDKKCL
jgi:hypothetical protein